MKLRKKFIFALTFLTLGICLVFAGNSNLSASASIGPANTDVTPKLLATEYYVGANYQVTLADVSGYGQMKLISNSPADDDTSNLKLTKEPYAGDVTYGSFYVNNKGNNASGKRFGYGMRIAEDIVIKTTNNQLYGVQGNCINICPYIRVNGTTKLTNQIISLNVSAYMENSVLVIKIPKQHFYIEYSFTSEINNGILYQLLLTYPKSTFISQWDAPSIITNYFVIDTNSYEGYAEYEDTLIREGIIGSGFTQENVDNAQDEGYQCGYEAGLQVGYTQEDIDNAQDEGYLNGYEEGLQAGFTQDDLDAAYAAGLLAGAVSSNSDVITDKDTEDKPKTSSWRLPTAIGGIGVMGILGISIWDSIKNKKQKQRGDIWK